MGEVLHGGIVWVEDAKVSPKAWFKLPNGQDAPPSPSDLMARLEEVERKVVALTQAVAEDNATTHRMIQELLNR